MGHLNRRIILSLVLFLGTVLVLTVIVFLVSKNRDHTFQKEGVQDTKKSLIREISNYDSRINKAVIAQGPNVSNKVQQNQQDAPKHYVHSSLPDTYAVVSVVPELYKEKYVPNQSDQSTNTSTQSEHRE